MADRQQPNVLLLTHDGAHGDDVMWHKVPRQSVIHIQDLKEIYFVTNLGYEDFRETAT